MKIFSILAGSFCAVGALAFMQGCDVDEVDVGYAGVDGGRAVIVDSDPGYGWDGGAYYYGRGYYGGYGRYHGGHGYGRGGGYHGRGGGFHGGGGGFHGGGGGHRAVLNDKVTEKTPRSTPTAKERVQFVSDWAKTFAISQSSADAFITALEDAQRAIHSRCEIWDLIHAKCTDWSISKCRVRGGANARQSYQRWSERNARHAAKNVARIAKVAARNVQR